MRDEMHRSRAILASALASLVAAATLSVIGHLTHQEWLGPGRLYAALTRGSAIGSWAITLSIPFAFGLLYAAWFDRLLGGIGPRRGLLFGGLVFAWTVVALGVMQGFGVAGLHSPRPLIYVLGVAASWLAFGVTIGGAYGGLRSPDVIYGGLSYGVPDRRSLA